MGRNMGAKGARVTKDQKMGENRSQVCFKKTNMSAASS